MQTTSSDPCPAASLRQRTSRRPPVTSHTSSTRAREGPWWILSPKRFRGHSQIQLIVNHTDTRSPRDPQTLKQTPTTTQLMKSRTMATIKTTHTGTRWSITATAITMAMSTGTERGRGNTSVGEGRNVCKGNFSFYSSCSIIALLYHITCSSSS